MTKYAMLLAIIMIAIECTFCFSSCDAKNNAEGPEDTTAIQTEHLTENFTESPTCVETENKTTDQTEDQTQNQVDNIFKLSTDEQFEFLVSLKGVGEKVANCVMLFGLGVMNAFPVDTWINKVYNKLTNTVSTDRKKITKELTARYANLSGYAQQYFFYYFRENKIT